MVRIEIEGMAAKVLLVLLIVALVASATALTLRPQVAQAQPTTGGSYYLVATTNPAGFYLLNTLTGRVIWCATNQGRPALDSNPNPLLPVRQWTDYGSFVLPARTAPGG